MIWREPGQIRKKASLIALCQRRTNSAAFFIRPHNFFSMSAAPPPSDSSASAGLSLARKWRPQTFADLVGHDYAARALQNAVRQNRLHHAFLFTGTRGVGKTTLARIVAKMVNCRDIQDGEPCLQCDLCQQIAAGRMLDVVELDAASHTQVEKMRDLLESAAYPPTQGKCKVFIIDEAHMLSKSAFAAMLKTLEEPPDYLKFVLATTDAEKLPPTIMSRCLCFALRPLERRQIAEQLTKVLKAENCNPDEAAVGEIARLARGSMRDALSILEQALNHSGGELEADAVRRIVGEADAGLIADILRKIAAADAAALPAFSGQLLADGSGFDAALARLAALLYKTCLFKVAPDAAADEPEEAAVLEEIGGLFSDEELQTLYEIAARGRKHLPLAPDEQTGFEMTLLRMTLFSPRRADSNAAQADDNAANSAGRDSGADSNLQSASRSNGGNGAAVKKEVRRDNGIGDSARASNVNHGANGATHSENDSPSLQNGHAHSNSDSHSESNLNSKTDPALQDEWRRIISQLSGTALALAESCALLQMESGRMILRVDKSQKESARRFLPELKLQLQQIQRGEVEVQLRDGDDDSAGHARLRERAAAAAARPFVRDILASMPGAQVRADSVRILSEDKEAS